MVGRFPQGFLLSDLRKPDFPQSFDLYSYPSASRHPATMLDYCSFTSFVSLIEEMKPCLGRVVVGFEGFQINGMGLKCIFLLV